MKLHIALDMKTKKIISLEATYELVGSLKSSSTSRKVSEKSVTAKFLYEFSVRFKRKLQPLHSLNAEAAIKSRKNSSHKSRDPYLRAKTVRYSYQILKMD